MSDEASVPVSPRDKIGLIERNEQQLKQVIEIEERLRTLLDRVRGSNIKQLNEVHPEPIPVGLPGIADQMERRLKNVAKQVNDLTETF